ncbi:hypothetical protein [Jeotgalibacillus malaysiensis]|uniref:hypothetical protein n=1 Tax=Jeotgalibacillus malaysiensis TaxID=1508404 RepID=UPI00384D989A
MRALVLIVGGILFIGLAGVLVYFSYFHERIGPVGNGLVMLFLLLVTIAAALTGLASLYIGSSLLMQKRKAK